MNDHRGSMAAVDPASMRKLMADLGGDPETIRELLATFLSEAPTIVAAIREAARRGDRRELNRFAHSLKSTSAMFGARDLSRLCRDIEMRSESALPPDADARVRAIEDEWERVRADLATWRA